VARSTRATWKHGPMIWSPRKRFLANPTSLRWATSASVTVTAALVLVGAVLMRVFDSDEYPTFGEAVWFTLQTITTVGYGDSTPVSATGRFVAAIVMLVAIGLITVITAIITSTFIESARKSRVQSEGDPTAASLARIEAALAVTQERLDQIEKQSTSQPAASDDAS
jgi:voltage-gated potassium channel